MSRKSKKKKWGWLLGFLLLLTIGLILSTGKRGFIQQIRINYKKKQLTKEIEMLQKEKERLEEEIEKLKTPEYTEKIAREKYGMAKKKEKVYHVVPEEKK